MALEDMIERCIEAGVTRFELYSESDERGDSWLWDLYKGSPVRWIAIPKPWSISFYWIGIHSNTNKLFGGPPFGFGFRDTWCFGIFVDARNGVADVRRGELEGGLLGALGNFLCESEGRSCPHEICEFHEDCLNAVDE